MSGNDDSFLEEQEEVSVHAARASVEGIHTEKPPFSEEEETAGATERASELNDGLVVRPTSTPMGIWAEGLHYTAGKKEILRGISMSAKPGELTAIMGSSGSGKTSLINCLLRRTRKGKVSGVTGINGLDTSPTNIRRHTHYVMSIDTNLAYLTVQETLYFTAQLRLPHFSKEKQIEAAHEVMQWLQLEGCKDTLVGGSWRKGISKGQLKRLAIAQELLGNPEILILDEPTTGLDSALALELVSMLKAVAVRSRKTIIASIHQPSQRAFELFDKLILLSDGAVLYQGPADQALSYFASVGRNPLPGSSPPDFLMEVATDQAHTGMDKLASPEQILNSQDEIPKYSDASGLLKLREQFEQSSLGTEVSQDIETLKAAPIPHKEEVREMEESQTWSSQFKVVWKRSTKNTMRNPTTTFIIVLVNIVQALVLGALFFQLSSDTKGVTTESFPDWPIWKNVILQYVTQGVDRKNSTPLNDPLRDMVELGIDGDQTSMVLDILMNPEMVNYLGDVMVCMRDLFPMASDQYPPWYWAPGSIQGNLNLTTTTTAPPAVPAEINPEDWEFGQLPTETIVSSIVGVMQILDSIQKTDFRFTDAETNRDDMIGYWVNVANNAKAYASVAFCCMGMEMPFVLIGASSTCVVAYPDYNLPTFPGAIDWKSSMKLLEAGERSLSAYLKFDQSQSNTKQNKRKTNPLPPLPLQQLHATPRRQLGSGLGGLVTDLYDLLFNDPSNPVYPLISNLKRIVTLITECETSNCQRVAEIAEQSAVYIQDAANSLLSILNLGGAIFFLVGNLGFMTYDVLLQFPRDRAMFNKEKADGLYRGSAYLLAKMAAEFPFQLIPTILWATIYYFMIGLNVSAGSFFLYLIIALLLSFASYSFGYFVSAFSPRMEIAIVVAPLLLMVMLVLAGFMIRDPQLPAFIAWFRFFSLYRWGFFGLLLVQFPMGGHFGSLPNALALEACGVSEKRLWANCVWLLSLAVIFRCLSYVGLVYTNRSSGLES